MELAVEIEGLTRHYRRRRGYTVAVDVLDLSVREGGVYGFLGPKWLGQDHHDRAAFRLPCGATSPPPSEGPPERGDAAARRRQARLVACRAPARV
jgi:hypothetical protein